MSDDEKIQIIDKMSKVANRRLEKLSKMEIPSPAFNSRQTYADDGRNKLRDVTGQWIYDEFSSEGKTTHRLSNEIKYMQLFLQNKTSTVTGAKDFQKDMLSRITSTAKSKVDLNSISYEQTKAFWEGYNKFIEGNLGTISAMGRQIADRLDSNTVQQVMYNFYQASGFKMTSDDLYEAAQRFADEDYATRIR